MKNCAIAVLLAGVCLCVSQAAGETYFEIWAEKYVYTGPGNDNGYGYEGHISVGIDPLAGDRTVETVYFHFADEN